MHQQSVYKHFLLDAVQSLYNCMFLDKITINNA